MEFVRFLCIVVHSFDIALVKLVHIVYAIDCTVIPLVHEGYLSNEVIERGKRVTDIIRLTRGDRTA